LLTITHFINVLINLLIMNKNYIIIALMMGIMFSGCTNQHHELTEQRMSQIENQILNEWEKICVTIEKSDSEGYASFISPDFILMGSQGSVFYSKEEYIANVRKWFATRKNTDIENGNIIVTVLSGNMALLNQESVFRVKYKDGNIQKVRHAASFVFKKGSSGWMIIHGHESFKDVV